MLVSGAVSGLSWQTLALDTNEIHVSEDELDKHAYMM
jgi:hypothetical protein